MKLFIDPGHGGTDSGASGNGLLEKHVNLSIAQKIAEILRIEYEGVDIRLSRTGDQTVSLTARTNSANLWGADFYLSIHVNSFNGSAEGYEDYIHTSLSDQSATAGYQRIIHEEVLKQNELRDRGRKKADFHVLRETTMPAILTENGFISDESDANKMKDPAWITRVARGHVNGLAKSFSLKKKASSNIYRVIIDGTQIGAYQDKDNALQAISARWNQFAAARIERI
ncbi:MULTISPECIES: N-acetylmuramoyl-L-alanine amidase family protein [Bacillus]|uniref:N-acetylmuramoyl-L-alanine amidase n=2 Tax=Bacillus TaxID=1386 RepID=A0A0M4FEP4_9BACI|nr:MULTISPECIES: N-acetylmuramoyl-L-alanine amidase [Bacillus]ALC80699.1 N-acetylmuramoyl-L-alanine amidase [Bacillus gobiensis]MBP1079591.1 N-acetylmuramoyl-L-alanine amidase [Bacillus capparidis]MED1094992.1 N-acetylmuramoyl-L-alanine amidase [Bacillus capparidis]